MSRVILSGRLIHKGKLVGGKFFNLDTLNYNFIRLRDFDNIFADNNVLNCTYSGSKLRSTRKWLNLKLLPVYDIHGRLIKSGSYTESQLIAIEAGYNVDITSLRICGALVSGAVYDIYSNKATRHAKMYYNEIRSRTSDVSIIAKRLDKSEKEILKVKNYLFMDYHNLSTGYKRFDESFDIAQSWQRLSDPKMTIMPHDITLINHELMELELVASGLDQDIAHRFAENEYNYLKESEAYYDKIKRNQGK